MNYYNELDPHAAKWLRNLIESGAIAPGEVDERSIEDVTPNDLRRFTQCHFFAGIGGWAYALDLAGWPRDRPVWTGSCPCQPFSAAGKGAGFDDERHLWPAWQHLIAQCRPSTIFGEQVASKAVDAWIDLVHADVEGMGYAFGSVPFPAAGIGAPHIRDRNYWLADADRGQRDGVTVMRGHERHRKDAGRAQSFSSPAACSDDGRMGNTTSATGVGERTSPTNGQWRDSDWLGCRDGKWRPVEPGTFPLAHGVSGRVGLLRGYGNAIVPQAAAEFIAAYLETTGL